MRACSLAAGRVQVTIRGFSLASTFTPALQQDLQYDGGRQDQARRYARLPFAQPMECGCQRHCNVESMMLVMRFLAEHRLLVLMNLSSHPSPTPHTTPPNSTASSSDPTSPTPSCCTSSPASSSPASSGRHTLPRACRSRRCREFIREFARRLATRGRVLDERGIVGHERRVGLVRRVRVSASCGGGVGAEGRVGQLSRC